MRQQGLSSKVAIPNGQWHTHLTGDPDGDFALRKVACLKLVPIIFALFAGQAFSQSIEDRFKRVIEGFQSNDFATALNEADAIIAALPEPLAGEYPDRSWQDIQYVKAVILNADSQCGAMLTHLGSAYLPLYLAQTTQLEAECHEALNDWLAASIGWERYAGLAEADFGVTPAQAALATIYSVYAKVRWRGPSLGSEEDLQKFDAALGTLTALGENTIASRRLRAKILFLFGQVLKARQAFEQLLSDADPFASVVLLFDMAVIDAQLGNWASVLSLTQEAMQTADPDHPMMLWLQGLHAISSARLGLQTGASAFLTVSAVVEKAGKIKPFHSTNFLNTLILLTHALSLAETADDSLMLIRTVDQMDWTFTENDHFGQLVFLSLTNQAALAALAIAETHPDEGLLSLADRLLEQGGPFRGRGAPAELKIPEFHAVIKLRRLRGEQDQASGQRNSINDLYRIMGKIAAEDIAVTPLAQVVAEQQKRAQFRSVFEKAISATFADEADRVPWQGSNYVHYPHEGEIPGDFGASYGVSDLTRERVDLAFAFAQHARLTTAGRAMASTLTRLASGSGALSDLLREYELLLEKRALVETEQSQEGRAARLAIDAQLADATQRLRTQYPKFDQILRPKVLSIDQIRTSLGPDEAVLKYVSTDEGLFAFLITPDEIGFNRQQVTTTQLAQMVAFLRKGLDPTDVTRSAEPLQPDLDPAPAGPAFPIETAQRLNSLLLRPHESWLTNVRTLYIVPDGPLLSLPFSMLVRDAPDAPITSYRDYTRVDWAIRHYAFSTLPILSALPLLNETFNPAPVPFVGIGNPQLSGLVSPVNFTRGAGDRPVDPDALRQLSPLPETARELRKLNELIARSKGLLFLGDAATEPVVRSGQLQDAQVIAFATHGLLGGDILGMNEPALVLSPPFQATDANDGLLTSSEIAGLKMNAAWVILSACNTAGGNDNSGTEGLSGLARAFLYAGARRLLVSHWPVQSDATVRLTTGMFEHLGGELDFGGPVALQATILDMINSPQKEGWSHPSVWAPFVVIGK